MTDAEKHDWAMFNVEHHPELRRFPLRLVLEVACVLAFVLIAAIASHCQTITPTTVRVTNPSSSPVNVTCISGCAGGGGNAAAGPTGSPVPASADYTGYNSAGSLVGVSTANPLPVVQQGTVTVSISGIPSVSVSNFPVTQPVSGTVTANQGGAPWAQNLTQVAGTSLGATAIVNYGSTPAAVAVPAVNAFVTNTVGVSGAISVSNFPATQPVSGTVTANQGGAPWAQNLTQVAGTALGATAVTNFGTSPAAAAVPGVNASLFSGTTALTNTAGAINVNYSSGSIPTGGNTIGKVDVLGNAGAVFDAANNAALPANVLMPGVASLSQGTQPTAVTSGNTARVLATVEGVLFVQQGNSNRFSCFVPVTATVTTQCQAAPGAGLRAYVTSATVTDAVTTAQSIDIVFGTGSNCATGTTALTAKWEFIGATETGSLNASTSFPTPLVPTAANAICCRPGSATAFGCTLTGFIAP